VTPTRPGYCWSHPNTRQIGVLVINTTPPTLINTIPFCLSCLTDKTKETLHVIIRSIVAEEEAR
jgi:hypothetical protein